MCGICGIANGSGEPVAEEILVRMRDALTHRGPDDAGSHIDGKVGIAMRRLSIIDLEGGQQPIFNEDGTICVVQNGEIYNYRELRDELLNRGHRFRTSSDTEVIVHLYEEFGDNCVDHLNGMFAFALWDSREQRLLLARDRLGIKPLYMAQMGGTLLFASELKSILEHPKISREVDPHALSEYLSYEYIPAPRTALLGVSKLPPATRAVWKDGHVHTETYWDVNFQPNSALAVEETCKEAIRTNLREAVRLQLRSDVPLGVLLSGGMDSSSLVAMMRELGVPIQTFSIGFQEKAYNELDAATEIARHFGTEHHALMLTANDVTELLPTLIGVLDEPLADASVIPTYLVCRLAREKVKVALSGDGGDESFGGYETYKAHQIAKCYRSMPDWMRAAVRKLVPLLPISSSHRGVAFKARKFTSGVEFPPTVANALWWGAYTPAEKAPLMGEFFKDTKGHEPFDAVHRVAKNFNGNNDLDRIFYQDFKLYLQDDLLVKVDRMSMANSLEVRVPFLDHTLVEFAATIPSHMKVNRLRLKYILRRAMQPMLPKWVISRPKQGFDIPLDAWIRGPLRSFILDTLSPQRIREAGYFNPTYLSRILDEHMRGQGNHRQLLWPLVVLEFWRQRYVAGTG